VANSPQAIKRARQNDVRRNHNQALRSDMRTSIKKVLTLIASNKKDDAYTAYQAMCSKVDSLGRKNTISANRASRLKSRINSRLKKTFAE
jgi:small subunit ribosomal protein S20